MKTVFITGADRGIGNAMCEQFLAHGWKVFAGQFMPRWDFLSKQQERYPDTLKLIPLDVSKDESVRAAVALVEQETDVLDMLINCAGIGLDDGCRQNLATFQVNTLGPIRMTEAFLPLMQKGMKRLCFVSSEAGSIALAHRSDSFSYCMSKTALNMAVKLMFNELRPKGYTFRLYHPGWVNGYMEGETPSTDGKYQPEDTARVSYPQFTEPAPCEDVLVMRDIEGECWSF